jgi:hypothetical protein
MIFPGMDPYLENPRIWPGIHSALIVYIRDRLQPRLGPRYVAAIEERVFVEGPQREIIPDVLVKQRRPATKDGDVAVLEVEADAPDVVRVADLEIHETYVAVLDRQSGHQVVTVIEVVSPSNKYAGPGRDSYLTKQREVLESQTHRVEIDLLRGGTSVVAVPEWAARDLGDYQTLVCVNRAKGARDLFELYRRGIRDRLPRIRIPLSEPDPDVPLDLQAVLSQTYEAGRYRDILRYDSPCTPPLTPDDQAWAETLIGHTGSDG